MPRPPLRLLRLVNPAVRLVLDSRAHRFLSGALLVLEYRGHRSAHSYRIPLRYAQSAGGDIVALAVEPERKLWWRSFDEPAQATLVLRGAQLPVVGALTGGDERDQALAAYGARFPRSATLARDAAVVVFTPAR